MYMVCEHADTNTCEMDNVATNKTCLLRMAQFFDPNAISNTLLVTYFDQNISSFFCLYYSLCLKQIF